MVFFLTVFSAALAVNAASAQYGAILTGAGATNRSMAGASTAAPLSAAGALYWNPATISGLPRSELEGGAELLFPHTRVESSLNPNSLGRGIPPIGLAGGTDSDTGAVTLPTLALAYLPEGSPLSFGLGVFAVSGFGVDYAGGATNPLLTPRPPAGVGFGPVYSDFQVLQIHPALAYKLTDHFSIGAGPTLDLARLRIDPFFPAPPDNANGDAFFTYPPGTHDATTWGAGFVVGAYYQADTWALGASFKSPQWLDKFRIDSSNELGQARQLDYELDLPLIVSLGAAYTGVEHWVFAADFRYIDFADAKGLGDSGFTANGAVRGPGWRSIFALALGAQYQLTDALSLRAGYSWNQNPEPNNQSFINTIAPTITQNIITAGVSWRVTEDFSLSLAYLHGFNNSITGPLLAPAGAVPGTSVRNSASFDSVVIGATVRFGGPRGHCGSASSCQPQVGAEEQSAPWVDRP
jgi:long-chain fatty acid transport protein